MNRTRPILSPRHRSVLETFAGTNVLLAFDYDGTLAPIAPTPSRARMRASTRRLLAGVARLYPCAVISGRAFPDISARLAGAGIQHVFGNHGLESAEGGVPHVQVRRWLVPLRAQLGGEPGVVIEDKGYSLTLHYRAARNRPRAIDAIHRVVDTLPGVRAIDGLEAVNLLPRAGANKGVALHRALEISACETMLYIGDEQTDEDAFGAFGSDRLLAIRVGRSHTSRARYHLESQSSVDSLLRALLEVRVRKSGQILNRV